MFYLWEVNKKKRKQCCLLWKHREECQIRFLLKFFQFVTIIFFYVWISTLFISSFKSTLVEIEIAILINDNQGMVILCSCVKNSRDI